MIQQCRGVKWSLQPLQWFSPSPADNSTTSADYTSWRIRRRHMGSEEKMKNAKRCCRTLISRGLDHSHWFFCLSVCAACRVERSGGRCSHCRWLLCGQRGSLRVDDMHSTDICTRGWRSMRCAFQKRILSEEEEEKEETLRCNLLCNRPKCLLFHFFFLALDWEAFYLHVTGFRVNDKLDVLHLSQMVLCWCLRREFPVLGV